LGFSLLGRASTTRLGDDLVLAFVSDFELGGLDGAFVVVDLGGDRPELGLTGYLVVVVGLNGYFDIGFVFGACTVGMAFSTDFAVTPIVAALSLALAAATRAALIRDGLR
jgi:hypothetical protein